MAVFPFFCKEHGPFDVFDKYDKARCPECRKLCKRDWSRNNFSFSVDFKPGWQPAFGKWVDTKRERNNLAAEQGLMRE